MFHLNLKQSYSSQYFHIFSFIMYFENKSPEEKKNPHSSKICVFFLVPRMGWLKVTAEVQLQGRTTQKLLYSSFFFPLL